MRNTILIMIILIIYSCESNNSPPVITLKAFPTTGDTSTFFEFDASGSFDDKNYPVAITYRWDINNDSQWDTEFDNNKHFGIKFNQPGEHKIIVQARDIDGATSQDEEIVHVLEENLNLDILVDPRDGNTYKTVKIDNRWWMAENLRVGEIVEDTILQLDNNIIENYSLAKNDAFDSIGGIYRWLEAVKYDKYDNQGICPEGWHIPSLKEWNSLFQKYPNIYCLKYYGADGLSNLDLHNNNGALRVQKDIRWFSEGSGTTGFWSSSFISEDDKTYPIQVTFNSNMKSLSISYLKNSGSENNDDFTHYYSVRCIKSQ